MPRDVAVVGPLNIDLLIIGEAPSSLEALTRWEGPSDIDMTAAGLVGHLVQDLARLGLDVGVVSCLPDDPLGAFLPDAFRRAGVHTERVRLVPSTVDRKRPREEKTTSKEANVEIDFPYIAGLLAFRVGPAICALLDNLVDIEKVAYQTG